MVNKQDSITWIDSLKGIAMCGVVMIHTGGGNLLPILRHIVDIGKNGVQLFFIISAYLAYCSIERLVRDNKGLDMAGIITWWCKKFLKLAPLYYLAILSYTLILGGNRGWLANGEHDVMKNILAHIFFVHGFIPHYANNILGVEWYLGVLAIFYICVPFLYRIINSFEKSMLAFMVVAFICPFINTFAVFLCSNSNESEIYLTYIGTFWIFTQLAVIMFGIVIYFLLKSNVLTMVRQRRLLSYTLLVFAIMMIAGQAYDRNVLFVIGKLTLFAFWFGMIIISQNLWTCKLINNLIFREIGKYSYPIYLFHFLLIRIYNRFIPLYFGNDVWDFVTRFCIIVLCSYLFARILVRFFDMPLNRWIVKKLHL